jgi:trehalose synthase
MKRPWQITLGDYAPLIGEEAAERIAQKAYRLRGLSIVHVSSTFYGGGVAEMLSSLTLLERSLGLRSDWRLIQGSPDFFSVTKKLHNALQGAEINVTDLKQAIYEEINLQNALRMELDGDLVVIHDPQPLPLVQHVRRHCPWIWRCHIDLSQPHAEAWEVVQPLVEQYDAVVLSLPEYAKELTVPQVFIMPGIDPFTTKNRALSDAEIDDRLRRYEIPEDLPLVVQVSRFDPWKDPEGVIEAFERAAREVPATLVLLGNVAMDDPEGQQVFESIIGRKSERVRILTAEDSAFVNALQRRADVVLQKSLREGFGLTVTEAMWKSAVVIGGDCGGIRRQIENEKSGFLVSSVEDAAKRIVEVLEDSDLRTTMGAAAHARVVEHFLLSRLLEDHLDLFMAFEQGYALKSSRLPARVRLGSYE